MFGPAMTTVPTPENHRPAKQFYILAFVVAIAIGVIGVLAFGLTRDPQAIPSPLIGRPMPDFSFALFAGGTLDTRALRGKVLIVNFWASWCYPACYEEAPRLQRMWERYRERGVVVIGANIQDRESPAREFIQKFGQTFPNGMDLTGKISIDFGVYGVPETFVVDQNGIIVAKFVGAVPEEWMMEHVERLLAREQGVTQ